MEAVLAQGTVSEVAFLERLGPAMGLPVGHLDTDIPDGHVYGKETWTPMAEVIPEPSTFLLLIDAGGALAWPTEADESKLWTTA